MVLVFWGCLLIKKSTSPAEESQPSFVTISSFPPPRASVKELGLRAQPRCLDRWEMHARRSRPDEPQKPWPGPSALSIRLRSDRIVYRAIGLGKDQGQHLRNSTAFACRDRDVGTVGKDPHGGSSLVRDSDPFSLRKSDFATCHVRLQIFLSR